MTEGLKPSPEIKWAVPQWNPKIGSYVSESMGVTAIGIGSVVYEAYPNGDLPVLMIDHSTPNAGDDYTRIYVGKADWERKYTKVVFDPEKPLVMDDSGRINSSASLAIDLLNLEKAWRASVEVQDVATRFRQDISRIVPESDVDTLDKIAVALDKLDQYVARDYPQDFLGVADQMEKLGIYDIGAGLSHANFWTPQSIRDFFGRNENLQAS